MPDYTVREIVPGVFAASGGICNRGIITDHGSVLVIDSGINADEATPLRTTAQEYHKQGSLSLFNTHPHGDHVYGNQVFADSTIIAHQGVRDDMVTNGEKTLAAMKQNPRMAGALDNVQITLPTATFQHDLTVFVGDIEVQLLYFGIAHSPSDSVAWLPQTRTLFTGDLLFNAIVPAMPPNGKPTNWIPALEKLEQLGAEHVIPGHGPIQTPAALTDLRNWFNVLHAQVKSAIASRSDLETATKNVSAEMQKLAPRGMDERLPMCIKEVFNELSNSNA
jgi:cyclase